MLRLSMRWRQPVGCSAPIWKPRLVVLSVVDTSGDSVLAVFDTAAGAVRAALDVQTDLSDKAAKLPEHRRLLFRIGIHLGDIVEKEDGTVYGDGVNIASRLQALSEPGGIMASHAVEETTASRTETSFEDVGEQRIKNIAKPIRAYRLSTSRNSKAAREEHGYHRRSGRADTASAWPGLRQGGLQCPPADPMASLACRQRSLRCRGADCRWRGLVATDPACLRY